MAEPLRTLTPELRGKLESELARRETDQRLMAELARRQRPPDAPTARVHPDIDPSIAPDVGYGVPPSETIFGTNPLLEMDRPETQTEALRRRGVLAEPTNKAEQRALAEGRRGQSFAVNEAEALNAIRIPLERVTGLPVEFRKGPNGNLEYQIQGAEWTRVDEPGFSVSDIEDLYGDMMVIGAELGGGIGGGIAGAGAGPMGSAAAAAGGAAGSAALAEAGRLLIGKHVYGINQEMTVEDIIAESAKEAGLSLAGSAAGVLFAKAVKGMANFIKGRGPVAGADELMEAAEQTAGVEEAVNRLAGPDAKPLKMTVAQRTQEPELLSMQARAEGIASAHHAKQYRQIAEQQMDTLDTAMRNIGLEQGPPTPPEQAGRAAQQVIRRREGEIMAPREQYARQTGERLEEAQAGIRAQAAEPTTVAKPTRAAAKIEQGKLKDWADKKYSEIDRLSEGKTIKVPEFRGAGQKLEAEAREDVFGDVPALLSKAAGRAEKVTKADIPGDLKRRIGVSMSEPEALAEAQARADKKKAAEPLTMGQLQRAITYLRDEIRLFNKGHSTEPSIGRHKFLLKALMRDRDDFLAKRGNAKLRQAIDEAEVGYKAWKDRLDRSVIADLVEREDGKLVLADEAIFDEVFKANNITPARELMTVLVDHPEAHLAWKGAILKRYQKEVMESANPAKAHKQFMDSENFGGVVRQFFTRDEMRQIEKVGGLQDVVDKAVSRRDRLYKRIQNTFAGELKGRGGPSLRSTEPSDIADLVMGNTERIKEFKKLMRNDPEVLAQVKGAILKKMDNQIRPAATDMLEEVVPGTFAPGRRPISGASLSKYITKNKDALTEMFGPKYVDDLTALSIALRYVQGGKRFGNPSGTVNALYDLTRAYVGIFTTPGRVVTAYRKIRGAKVDQVLSEALTDMDKFKQLMELRKIKPGTPRAAAIIGALVAGLPPSPSADADKGVSAHERRMMDYLTGADEPE